MVNAAFFARGILDEVERCCSSVGPATRLLRGMRDKSAACILREHAMVPVLGNATKFDRNLFVLVSPTRGKAPESGIQLSEYTRWVFY